MRLFKTKADRLAYQNAQFETLLKAGYSRETYKGLEFFTKNDNGFLLKVFRGSAAHHVEYVNYRSEERRAEVIKNYKLNHDRREQYKAELKANPKASSAENCAAAIREELKNTFPGVKFSVKSSNFSGGDSVHISYYDGPSCKEVESITDKYQYGHFNGMEDLYENSNMRDDIPQSKYVSVSRSISDELKAIILPDAERIFSDSPFDCHDVHNWIYRVFYPCSIPAGSVVTGIESTGITCGVSRPDTFYKIAFTIQETATKIKEDKSFDKVEVRSGEVNIINYSEKAIAVIGDTKPIKDKLKALGGKFNFRLSCGAGWIFPKTKLNEIQTALTA